MFLKNKPTRFFLIVLTALCLSACASSDLSRQGASSVDQDVQATKNVMTEDYGDISDHYQNASQASKGLLFGSVAGAATGAIAGGGSGAAFGAAAGAVIGAIAGATIDAHANLSDQLINRGGNVVVLGDQILIVIPSARLFDPYTATINPAAYSTLRVVTHYINRFYKILVKVSVYTADTGRNSIDQSLSQEEANSIVKFLEASGLNSRVLYGAGLGGIQPVIRSTDWDSDNYRVEITLQKLYV